MYMKERGAGLHVTKLWFVSAGFPKSLKGPEMILEPFEELIL